MQRKNLAFAAIFAAALISVVVQLYFRRRSEPAPPAGSVVLMGSMPVSKTEGSGSSPDAPAKTVRATPPTSPAQPSVESSFDGNRANSTEKPLRFYAGETVEGYVVPPGYHVTLEPNANITRAPHECGFESDAIVGVPCERDVVEKDGSTTRWRYGRCWRLETLPGDEYRIVPDAPDCAAQRAHDGVAP